MRTIYTESQIKDAINKVAYEIRWSGMNQRSILYICVLSGGLMFFSDLVRQLPTGDWGFVKSSRYGSSQVGNDEPELTFIDVDPSNHYDSIVVVDDICDDGVTLDNICNELEGVFPSSEIISVVLLNRVNDTTKKVFSPDYSAIDTSDEAFFAGYGMDENGKYREATIIYDCR